MAYSFTSNLEKHREESDGDFFVANPDRKILFGLYDVFSQTEEDHAGLRILIDEKMAKELMDEFFTSSKAGGLVEAEVAEIRTIEYYERNSLIVSEAGLMFWTQTDAETVSIFESTPSDHQNVMDSLASEWGAGDEYSIRTPGLPRLRETMEAELGKRFREEFDSILADFDELPKRGDGFNVYSVALLAAAKNEILFYDLGKWAEDVGLASKATFTRKKQQLEEAGVIETSKQTIDVGRPRLRLHLVNEESDYLAAAVATTETG